MKRYEFTECDTCRAKPGSPHLCIGCLKNRDVIAAMNKQLEGASSLVDVIRRMLKFYEPD